MKLIPNPIARGWYLLLLVGLAFGCKIQEPNTREPRRELPSSFGAQAVDTASMAKVDWQTFFQDPILISLIDTALIQNQELNAMQQEILIAQNEIRARKGEYIPFVNLQAVGGVDKVGRYTRFGALEANQEISPGKEFPEPLSDLGIAAVASWEIDVWKKLRNAKKAAMMEYLSSVEGRNFLVTELVAEIANSYYELMALDNQLETLQEAIRIQNAALTAVRFQKDAARVTELAVKRFEAEVAKNQSLIYEVQQQIKEEENRINFLLGRYPQQITRSSKQFFEFRLPVIQEGLPSQLLSNRPDIREAEFRLEAAKLQVQVAKAAFYPSIRISAGFGYQSYRFQSLFQSPESLLYSAAGDLISPLINRNAIKAAYNSANAKQMQAVYELEMSILNGFLEVSNQLSNLKNLESALDYKGQQVDALTQSISISDNLFKSARADYVEVLLTQREAIESKLELIETKKAQFHALVNTYQALGGGWNRESVP
ncbi:TolC family protein [Algoriphagus namhaensis]